MTGCEAYRSLVGILHWHKMIQSEIESAVEKNKDGGDSGFTEVKVDPAPGTSKENDTESQPVSGKRTEKSGTEGSGLNQAATDCQGNTATLETNVEFAGHDDVAVIKSEQVSCFVGFNRFTFFVTYGLFNFPMKNLKPIGKKNPSEIKVRSTKH